MAGSDAARDAEVAEGVRATIARYTHALDDGRTDEVVATFCEDGVFEMPGLGTFEGRAALHDAYSGWLPRRPQRHLVLNTLVTPSSATTADAVSDVVLIVAGSSGWSVQFVARYRDALRVTDGEWRFARRTVEPEVTS